MNTVTLNLQQAVRLSMAVLQTHRTSAENARFVTDALVAAELDGQAGHGLSRLPSYAAQARSGKVDGTARPRLDWAAQAALRVDAAHGFAYPALADAIEAMAQRVKDTGIVLAAVRNSHHCGMAGYHVEQMARHGMIGLMFANSPHAMAPWGGSRPVFGTNPIAFAVPRADSEPMVIDLSLSKVARGKIMVAAQNGKPIPEGWALDSEGNPTTDAKAALDGSMVPMGDAKGAALALMVEILAAAVPGASLAFEASSFFTADGPPPDVGQMLIGIHADPVSGGAFTQRLETLLYAIIEQPGTRLPGDRRLELRKTVLTTGLSIPENLHQELVALSQQAVPA